MATPRKPRVGRAIRSNVGIEVAYRKKLDALLTEMQASLVYWLTARWKANPPATMAQDENPTKDLLKTMRVLRRRWESKWDDAADRLAKWFARQVTQHSTLAMTKVLEAGKVPTVEFKMSAGVRDAVNAIVGENVALIKSIAAQHLTAVEVAVTQSVATGRDLGTLAKELEHRYGVTKRRAAFIAHHQNNMASAVITRTRQVEAGITTCVWMHSHGGKTPRKSHLAYNGKTYEVETGAFIDGEYILPGVLPNCRCFSKPVLVGF